ncbi:MAG: 2-phospho-L-lactate transferase [Halobacteriales archaeon]
MTTFLSGGTGTPKLLDGGRDVLDGFNVVVNTGDDIEIAGNLVCPDIDTVLYTLSDRIDRDRWWGVDGDSHATHDALTRDGVRVERVEAARELGVGRAFSGDGEFMLIGDEDRATQVVRSSALDSGATLTEATERVASWLGVPDDERVLPVTDDRVATYIETDDGTLAFQVWWVAREGEPEPRGVEFRGADDAEATGATVEALKEDVVIGPSNPVTSIGPMLAVDGVRDALRETHVVAVSPFVGGEVVSGPAARLMRAVDLPPSSEGVYEAYSDFLDVLVVDGEDPEVDCRVVETDTSLDTRDDAARLTETVVNL